MAQKKACNLSGRKTNHATSQGEKIMQHLGTKTNHATALHKREIMPPLRGEKIMQHLGTKKNHATFQDKKSQNLGTIKNFKIFKICFKVNLKIVSLICHL